MSKGELWDIARLAVAFLVIGLACRACHIIGDGKPLIEITIQK